MDKPNVASACSKKNEINPWLATTKPIVVTQPLLRVTDKMGSGNPNDNRIYCFFIGSGKRQGNLIIQQIALVFTQVNPTHMPNINHIAVVNSKKIKR